MVSTAPRKKRLSRAESQAATRRKLLESAFEVVSRHGYDGASVEMIAEEAGFSKGAFYSNFNSKEDILLQLLHTNASNDVEDLTELFADLDDAESVLSALKHWSDSRSANQKWGTIAIEFVRRTIHDGDPDNPQLNIFVAQWKGVGKLLQKKLNISPSRISALNLGGLVLEVTYGGISGFLKVNTSGEMLDDMLRMMLGPPASEPADSQGGAESGQQ
ncbi:TetR/AcrR family transcriptional regulator [Roseinatronobacter alkalisoli]|uniref:TetR/AcrR family transcriptional regulator n=1 Tax=Roseinatronobacter alkalisoli TaxID=3028235 RepID=A0ABT5TCZ2_9RHOB|nr:TetR/AcrR family transcriptional regulator [Roseinatronobacter sp. HJB301]MDD7972844.1 TetR/AcrR family transcriptional regulator [Roseinatronobacter sp. HJB301]